MNCELICKDLREFYNQDIKMCKIHSIYRKTLNAITSEGYLISILSSEKTMSPFSILLDKKIDFTKFDLSQGMKLTITDQKVQIENIRFHIDLTNSSDWDCTPYFKYKKAKPKKVIEKLKILEECIVNDGNIEGIAPVIFKIGDFIEELKPLGKQNLEHNQYSLFIINRLVNFIDKVMNRDRENISDSTKKIIGFGPGLTPSTDDFISGLMISLIYVSQYFDLNIEDIEELNEKIISDVLNKTTYVSKEMLRFSSYGATTQDNRNFIISLLSKQDIKEFKEKLTNVMNFGGTSGTDVLCGMYVGSRILFSEKSREVF